VGQRVLYFSSSLPLCVLEVRANAVSFERIRAAHHYCTVDAELSRNSEIAPDALYFQDWTSHKLRTQQYGGDWYTRKSSLILVVKSAVLSTDTNYIINSTHPAFESLIFSSPAAIPLDCRLN
jgi:RES domain-containing protein